MDDHVVIALFRHGITEENKRKAYLGWGDSQLSAESRKMSPLKSYGSYFSSDLQRCLTTSNIYFPNQKPIAVKAFREMNFGEWEGKTYEDLKDDQQYHQWISDPENVYPPKGEAFHEFINRIQDGWDAMIHTVLRQQRKSCAVITHGGVIRYLLSKYAPEEREFWSFHVRHDQGYELVFSKEDLKGGRRCTSLLEVPLMANEHG